MSEHLEDTGEVEEAKLALRCFFEGLYEVFGAETSRRAVDLIEALIDAKIREFAAVGAMRPLPGSRYGRRDEE